MNQVKNLDFEYIVATDLAARGIDIEGVSHVINDAIPQDLSFFVHRVGRTGRNGLPGVAITLYQPSDDSDIRELEKMGIRFVPKVLKNGVIEDTYDRDRRANREKKQEKLDIEMIGLVKKKKKKIKPGYKKKSNGQLMKSGERLSELKIVRVAGRNERPNDKLSNPCCKYSGENIDFFFMNSIKKKLFGNLSKIYDRLNLSSLSFFYFCSNFWNSDSECDRMFMFEKGSNKNVYN